MLSIWARDAIRVDRSLRTSLRHVYASGDVTRGPQFTHSAVWQSYAAARKALFPGRTRVCGRRCPGRSSPTLRSRRSASPEPRRAGAGSRCTGGRWTESTGAQAEGELDGFIKLVTSGSDGLLGATIFGTGAADLANLVVEAMDAGVGLARLARAIHVYSTRSYGLSQLAAAVRLAGAASGWRVRLARCLTWGWGRAAGPL